MKRLVLGLLACTLLCVCSCSRSGVQKSLPKYSDFSQIAYDYSIDNAIVDKCVVFTDLALVSGGDIWFEFLDMIQSGNVARVRIAQFYTGKVQTYHLSDLSYDGSLFVVTEMAGVVREYKYLNHYSSEAGKDADYSALDSYILVNKEDLTYDDLERALISSTKGDYIDQYRIYVNIIK